MKTLILKPGEDPLKMQFAQPRPNPLRGCMIGIGFMMLGTSCCLGTMLAMGIIKWP